MAQIRSCPRWDDIGDLAVIFGEGPSEGKEGASDADGSLASGIRLSNYYVDRLFVPRTAPYGSAPTLGCQANFRDDPMPTST
jgi:hypothetical protein